MSIPCLDGMCQECAWDGEIVPASDTDHRRGPDGIPLCDSCLALYDRDGLLEEPS